MTNEQINEFLTIELFGECWHDRKIVTEWEGDHEVVICKCLNCGRESDEVFANPNFFTPDGMLKVIDAMRARMLNVDTSSDVLNHGASCFDDHTGQPDKRNWTYTDNLPEAVARAAVEFLKTEVK